MLNKLLVGLALALTPTLAAQAPVSHAAGPRTAVAHGSATHVRGEVVDAFGVPSNGQVREDGNAGSTTQEQRGAHDEDNIEAKEIAGEESTEGVAAHEGDGLNNQLGEIGEIQDGPNDEAPDASEADGSVPTAGTPSQQGVRVHRP